MFYSPAIGHFTTRLAAVLALFCVTAVVRAEDKVTYDDHVAPIFRQRCASCHSATSKKADLDVTNYLSLMQGGASGKVIEEGDPDASHLFNLVDRTSEPFMPQNADKLPDAEIELLRRWIAGGALENSGSKAKKPKAKMAIAAQLDPGKRPDVVALPLRMVLEPQFTTPHAPMARSMATHPWAPVIAVTGQRQVLLYDTSTLQLVGILPFPEGQPNVVRFSRDGVLLIAGGGRPAASGKVVVWDVTTGQRVTEVGNELDVVLAADISADHKQIALGGPQRVLRVYSTETGQLLYEKSKHTDWVLSIEFSPDGVLLASADRSGGLLVWEATSGNEYLTLAGHTGAVTAVSWRGDSNLLASASEDATVRLWELENGTAVKNWSAKAAVLSAEVARDGRIVTCGRDQITRIWDQEGKQLVETKPIGEVAVSAAFCDETARAIAASWAGVVQVYKADDASAVGTLVTNPPKLEERLAIAQQTVKDKTAVLAPLAEAVLKAEKDFAAAQTALAAAQKEAEVAQAEINRLAMELKQINELRAATDAERQKLTATLAQAQEARPLVAESLRHLTEAIGKRPQDAQLVAVQGQLTEQLKAMESQATEIPTKLNELATAVTAADAKLAVLAGPLEVANRAGAAAAERVKAVDAQMQQANSALEIARKTAQPVEAELAQAGKDVTRWQDEISFRNQMAALQGELEAARKVAAERQAEIDQANEQLTTAQSAVEAAKAKLDEAATGIEAVNAKVQAARKTK